mmetsp:Transcript_20137/g.37461  ORF Transcript_20137/g.37461 Transcript_20137/m.37461 type:complete len:185 (-) Transcript_20137:989-1543(-)
MFGEMILELLAGAKEYADPNFRDYGNLVGPVGLSSIVEESVMAPFRFAQSKAELPVAEASPSKRKPKFVRSMATGSEAPITGGIKAGLTMRRLQTHPYFESLNFKSTLPETPAPSATPLKSPAPVKAAAPVMPAAPARSAVPERSVSPVQPGQPGQPAPPNAKEQQMLDKLIAEWEAFASDNAT